MTQSTTWNIFVIFILWICQDVLSAGLQKNIALPDVKEIKSKLPSHTLDKMGDHVSDMSLDLTSLINNIYKDATTTYRKHYSEHTKQRVPKRYKINKPQRMRITPASLIGVKNIRDELGNESEKHGGQKSKLGSSKGVKVELLGGTTEEEDSWSDSTDVYEEDEDSSATETY